MIPLKKLEPAAVSAALEKAKQYRLLGEPEEAESICKDILEAVPSQEEAMIILFLALTDKFAHGQLNPAFNQAQEILESLHSSHCKPYYRGILLERRAKHHLKKGGPGSGPLTYEWLIKAMNAYNEAMESCSEDGQKAILRWNSCARVINTNPEVQADSNEANEMLLDSFDTPH